MVRTGTARGPSVLPYVYCTVLLVLFSSHWPGIFDETLDGNGDNAAYYILGKALYLGEGYTYINTPTAAAANNLPPGYPALVALTMALWSPEFAAIKVVNGIFLLLSVLALFILYRHLGTNVHLAFVAALAAFCNGHLLHSSIIMMSEVPFLFFSTAALLLFTRLQEENFRQPQIYLLLVCLVAAYYIRSMGVALLVAICLELAWQRRWKYLGFVTTGFVLAALPWYIRGRGMGGNAYLDQLLSINPYRPDLGRVGWSGLALRLYENAQRYIHREIPDSLLYYIERDWTREPVASDWLLGILSLLLVGYGFYRLRAHRRLIVLYVAATGGIVLLWPQVWPGTRFIQPLIPLLWLAVCNSLYAFFVWGLEKVGSPWRFQPLLLLLPLWFIFVPDLNYHHRLATTGKQPNNWINYYALAEWAKQNTEPEAIIACRKPVLFYLYSNRRTVVFRFTTDGALLLEDLKQKQVDYVVIDQLGSASTERYLLPAVIKYEKEFSLVHSVENPSTWLVAFQPSDEL
jgi:hypothetical protein